MPRNRGAALRSRLKLQHGPAPTTRPRATPPIARHSRAVQPTPRLPSRMDPLRRPISDQPPAVSDQQTANSRQLSAGRAARHCRCDLVTLRPCHPSSKVIIRGVSNNDHLDHLRIFGSKTPRLPNRARAAVAIWQSWDFRPHQAGFRRAVGGLCAANRARSAGDGEPCGATPREAARGVPPASSPAAGRRNCGRRRRRVGRRRAGGRSAAGTAGCGRGVPGQAA